MPRGAGLREELAREIERDEQTVLDRARREGEGLIADAEARCRKRVEEAEAELAVEAALLRRRARARAEMEGRNRLLRLKQEEIDRVFTEAEERLLKLEEDPPRLEKLLGRLLEEGRRQLPPGPRRIVAGPAAAEVLRPEAGEEWSRRDGLQGLIVETADGRVRWDASFAALLARLREEREAEIARLLFREEENHGRE